MAIISRKNKVQKPTEEDVSQDTPNEDAPETKAPKAQPRKKAAATKEVAVKRDGLPTAMVATEDAPTIKSLEYAIDPVDLGTMLRRAVGASGDIVLGQNKKVNFGEFVDIQVMSTSNRWMVTPDADQKDTKARKLCRASYDGGETIPGFDGGASTTVDDWIEEMAEAGYEANPVSKYLDIFGVIFNSEKNQDSIDDAELVQISVSPTAVRTFNAFTMQIPLKVARGQVLKSHQNCIRVAAEAISGDYNYTVLKFQPVPLEVLQDYTPVLA